MIGTHPTALQTVGHCVLRARAGRVREPRSGDRVMICYIRVRVLSTSERSGEGACMRDAAVVSHGKPRACKYLGKGKGLAVEVVPR